MTPTTVMLLTPSIRLLGARQSLLELSTHMEASRWRPFVICSGRGGLQEKLAERGIPHAVVPQYAWRKGRFLLARYWQVWHLTQWAMRERPALIHANEFHSFPHAWACARLLAWRMNLPAPPPA